MGRGWGFEVAVDHHGGLCGGEDPGQASRGDDHGEGGRRKDHGGTGNPKEETTVVWRSMVEIAGPMTMAKPVDWEGGEDQGGAVGNVAGLEDQGRAEVAFASPRWNRWECKK